MTLYVEPDPFKATVQIPDAVSDADVDAALEAASRAVEQVTHRRFWKDTAAVQRAYTATSPSLVFIDDIARIDEVTVDGTVLDDYDAEPLNAALDNEPWLWLESDRRFTSGRGEIQVTGLFGWPQIPGQVPQLVTIVAAKLLKRSREAPWGIVTSGGIEGTALRITREDPDAQFLIGPLKRRYPVVA